MPRCSRSSRVHQDACATTAVVHTRTHTPSVTVTHSLFQFAVQRLYVYYSQSQLTSQTVDLCVSFWILVAVGSFSRQVAFPSSLKNR